MGSGEVVAQNGPNHIQAEREDEDHESAEGVTQNGLDHIQAERGGRPQACQQRVLHRTD